MYRSRRERQIERLGGIPDVGPDPEETAVAVLQPENHAEIDEPVEVEASIRYDSEGRVEYGSQELEILTPGVELTDEIRRAASRCDRLGIYEY
jgi:hypothetical protein